MFIMTCTDASGDECSIEGEYASVQRAIEDAMRDCADDAQPETVFGPLSWPRLEAWADGREDGDTLTFTVQHCTGPIYTYMLTRA